MVKSSVRKDKDIFTRLVMMHITALKRFARTLCKNDFDADDLVSDTVLRGYEKFHLLRDPLKVKQWLFSILNNQFVSNYRMRRKFVEMPSPEIDDDSNTDDFSLFESLSKSDFIAQGDTEDKFISRLTMKDIDRAVNSLPEEFRVTLTLCDIEEFSYEEIAKTLKIPVGTVRSRIARARAILQKKLWSYARDMGIKKSKSISVKKEYTCTCGKVETTGEMKLVDNI